MEQYTKIVLKTFDSIIGLRPWGNPSGSVQLSRFGEEP